MHGLHLHRASRGDRILYVERACWIAGGVLMVMCLGTLWDAMHGRQRAVEQFTSPPSDATQSAMVLPVDTNLWSASRLREYTEGLTLEVAPPVALLRIRRVALEVPVFFDDRALHLNRGAGLIPGTQPPGVGGNLGIAGHRDGFFRVLKDVRVNDRIEVQTRARRYDYRIVSIDIVASSNTASLADTADPTVTLVTCYPFYFAGHAPQRFIVRGMLENVSLVTDSRHTT